MSNLRQSIGCWLNERWRTELALASTAGDEAWLDLRNRSERLQPDARTGGRECAWTDSSVLTVSRVFPEVGPRLLRKVLSRWPIAFAGTEARPVAEHPHVSILIPIGGTARMHQFELALAAARAQQGVDCEVVVVEQAPAAELDGHLPADVRYFHQASKPAMPFNKSWALNRAAREARGGTLLVLDADYLLPARFAAECHAALERVEGLRPARLIFHLDDASARALWASREFGSAQNVEKIVANNPTPLALRRSTYWEIGGHDENYFGWGGEDTEFLDRLRTRDISEAGWLPVVHAWHAAAAKKADGDRNRGLHEARMAIAREQRIAALRASSLGAELPLPLQASA